MELKKVFVTRTRNKKKRKQNNKKPMEEKKRKIKRKKITKWEIKEKNDFLDLKNKSHS